MKNTNKAVMIIAVLSLFLGFSLGQNHRQSMKIRDLKVASFNHHEAPHHYHQHHLDCELQSERLHERMEELRVRLEERRAYLESQRNRLEEAYRQEMEEKEKQIRYEIKDSENGSAAIIRIIREE